LPGAGVMFHAVKTVSAARVRTLMPRKKAGKVRVEPVVEEAHPDYARACQLLAEVGALLRPETPSRGSSLAERLQFDQATWTVHLDGTPYRIDRPKAFLFYKTLAEHGGPITRKELATKDRYFTSDKAAPRLITELPTALQETVERDQTGYWLRLPPRKKIGN
jgi:hypothetical protein